MKVKTMPALKITLALVLAVQLSGCGTLLYPERRGQKGGSVDAGVAVLDGVLLLFFVVPGVIAYVVDFSTGAIYLPGHRRAEGQGPMRVVRLDPARMTGEEIRRVISRETGIPVEVLETGQTPVSRLDNPTEIPRRLAAATP